MESDANLRRRRQCGKDGRAVSKHAHLRNFSRPLAVPDRAVHAPRRRDASLAMAGARRRAASPRPSHRSRPGVVSRRDADRLCAGTKHIRNTPGRNTNAATGSSRRPSRSPAWSPDGASIRFTLDTGEFGTQSIWEMTSEGNGLHAILSKSERPSRQSAGNWTADGKYFLFSGCEEYDCNLWGIRNAWSWFRRAHHAPFALTSGPDSLDVTIPAQMGSRIFAFSFRSHRELEKIDPRTQSGSTLNLDTSLAQASFSPDDEMVVYSNRPDDSLWRSRIDGEARIPLTITPLHGRYARWSPDGKQILFTGARQSQPSNIYVISPDGGSLHPVLPGGWEGSEADWSPDGYRIVVSMRNQKAQSEYGLYTLEPTTGTLKELPGSKGLMEPRWSPDSRYIAAIDAAKRRLLLYDVRKADWSLLASGGLLESLHWAHDSSMIYFQDQIEEQESIFRGSVATRKVERVFGFGELLRGSATHCYFTGLDRTGSYYVMIERGMTDIYALDLDLP